MANARARLPYNLVGSAAVLAVMLFVAWGLPAINRLVPAGDTAVGGRPYAVGAGVVVVPPAQAKIDPGNTRPGPDRGRVLFLVGPVRYVIVVAPFGGDLAHAAGSLRSKIAGTDGYRVTGPDEPVTTTAGLTGLRGSYSAPGRVGRYAVFAGRGRSIEVTVSGSRSDLTALMSGIETSIATIEQR